MTYQPLDDNNDGVVDADVDNESVSTEHTATETLADEATGANWLGMDPSLTHARTTSLSISEVLNATWHPDHRNPVQAEGVSWADSHQGHTGGAPDPRVINDDLHVFSEGATNRSSLSVSEDIYHQHFSDAGVEVKSPLRYIGNDTDAEARVAPRVLYIPEQDGYVMGHSTYAVDDSWAWNFEMSKPTDGIVSWDTISGADPLLENTNPHYDMVRVGDTLYVFHSDGETDGYFTLPVDDLTAYSGHTAVDLPNQSASTWAPSLTRCRDGWLLINAGNWSDLEVWSTTFDEFPHGWTFEGTNPFGFERVETWNAGGHRNVCLLDVDQSPMIVAPGTPSGSSTESSQNGFYRTTDDTKHKMASISIPDQIIPAANITQGGFDTWTTLSHPDGTLCQGELRMDPKSAQDIRVKGAWGSKYALNTSGWIELRLRDTDAGQTLAIYSRDDGAPNEYGGESFDIRSPDDNQWTNNLAFQLRSESGIDALYQGYKRGGLYLEYPIGRLVDS